eukprot:GFKZ01011645.1.p1 GENE.GFKZ01011645.1~~GFKZ01011645.1.p1  ORF type:complete len:788 (+),score=145.97 GFKZ01011645.1:92-2365(+)
MSEQPYPEPAFVGTTAPKFQVSFNSTLGLSSSRPRTGSRCRNGSVRNWRCTITDEGVGDVTNHTGASPDAAGEAQRQVEGPISGLEMTSLDDGLQDALSKSWDILQRFEAGMELPVVEVNEEKEDKASNAETDAPEIADESQAAENDDESLAEQKVHSIQKGENLRADIVREQEMLLAESTKESPHVLESDSAVEAVEDAKKGRKGRKKSGTGKSSKATSAAKKRGKKKAPASTSDDGRQLTKREILDSEAWDPDPHWYFLQVKPGCEQSCAISIRNMAKSLDKLEVHEVLVPATTILRLTKGGQSRRKEERIFPGYILVRMVMNYQNYNDLQKIPNVQYFMGDPNRDKDPNEPFRSPIPVSDAEMKVVYDKVSSADKQDPEEETMLRPGDSVEVLWGDFKGSKGLVNEVKPHRNIVTVRLLMFGREKPVELEIDQVAAIPDIEELSQQDGYKEVEGDESAETKKIRKNAHTTKSSEKRSTQVYGKRPNADLASAADDLAALLADVPSTSDGEFDDFFTNSDDSTDFDHAGESATKTRGIKSRQNSGGRDFEGFLDFDESKAGDRNLPNMSLEQEYEELQFPEGKLGAADGSLGDDNVADPFPFLDEDINPAEEESGGSLWDVLHPTGGLVEERSETANLRGSSSWPNKGVVRSEEGLASFESDDALRRFLSDGESDSIWDSSEDFLSVHEPQGSSAEGPLSGPGADDTQIGNLKKDVQQEDESYESASLDEFDEAEVILDTAQDVGHHDTEEKSSN